jgi:hypothetical protein
MQVPTKEEYESWGSGVRHVPTNIRVELAYQNVEGGWTLNCFLGDAKGYDEQAVIQYGGSLLLE